MGSLALCWLTAQPLAATEKSLQKVFGEVKPDQALVYVFREGFFQGGGLTARVYADQQFLGVLVNDSYTFSYLPPGPHLLWLNWTKVNSQVELEAGKVYYFNVRIKESIQPLDEITGPGYLSGIKWYVTPEDGEREEAKEQIEEDYAKVAAAVAKKPKDAPQVAAHGQQQEHVAKWPQVDLKPFSILCIEDFVMADPNASKRAKGFLVESAPSRLAKLVISDLGPGVFEEVRQRPTCEAAAGMAVLRARIMIYVTGSKGLLGSTDNGSIKVHFILASGEAGNTLSEFDAKGYSFGAGDLGTSRGIQYLEKNVAYEMASYLKHSKGVAEPPEATK